jgi:MHS family proline/betaine transporter-like MFS transporter
VFGGTAPFLATWLVAGTGYSLSPAIYVAAIAVVSFLVATFLMPETAGRPLRRYHDDPMPAEPVHAVAPQAATSA